MFFFFCVYGGFAGGFAAERRSINVPTPAGTHIYIYIYIYHLSCEGHVVVNPPPCPRSLTASCFEPRLRLHPELLDGAGDADVTSAR